MIIRNKIKAIAAIIQMSRNFNQVRNNPDSWLEWAQKEIVQHPVFVLETCDNLERVGESLCLFCLGHKSEFDELFNN